AMGPDRCVALTRDGAIHVLQMRSGRELWKYQMVKKQLPWQAPPQVAGELLLTCCGRNNWQSAVFDMTSGRLLGKIALGQRSAQAFLTAGGLVVVCDGRSLRLIEPVLGITESVWSVPLAANLKPAVLTVTDAHVVVSPNAGTGVVELRSLAEYGRIVRTFQTQPVAGKVAMPIAAVVTGNRLYVVAGLQGSPARNALPRRQIGYIRCPSLHAFNLTTGKRLWSADLTPPGGRNNMYIMPVQLGRD
ncbi:unnamed protein product, partial [marine sediment metagenome]